MDTFDPPVSGCQGVAPDVPVTSPDLTPELEALAERIRARDRILEEGAHSYWLQNGLDLIAAKRLLGHGSFEGWCKERLRYSKSLAEKLMRAAALFGQMLKSGTVTDLPPPTLAYVLSAPSLPDSIRNEFVPRLIAADKTARAECKAAIAAHKEAAKRAKRRAALSPEQQVAVDKREAAKAMRDAREEKQRDAERETQAKVRSAAVDLIVARLGDDLSQLLALTAEAGPSSIFSFGVTRELERRAQAPLAVCDEKAGLPAESSALPSAGDPAIAPGVVTTARPGGVLGPYFETMRQRQKHAAPSSARSADQLLAATVRSEPDG